ncbi:cleavage and polyadenylation specificity factor (CPSF) A subunit protein [Wolffia australiana]
MACAIRLTPASMRFLIDKGLISTIRSESFDLQLLTSSLIGKSDRMDQELLSTYRETSEMNCLCNLAEEWLIDRVALAVIHHCSFDWIGDFINDSCRQSFAFLHFLLPLWEDSGGRSGDVLLMMADEEASGPERHYLAKYVMKGGMILQAVRGRFRSQSSYDIVFGKETWIELVVLCEDGNMLTFCEQNVFGIIRDLVVLPASDRLPFSVSQGRDLLVVSSDSPYISILSFCPEMRRFVPLKRLALTGHDNSSTTCLGAMLAVDSCGYFVAASAYEDRFAVLCVSPSPEKEIIDQIIHYPTEGHQGNHIGKDPPEFITRGIIWSMSFVSKDKELPAPYEHDCLLALIIHRKGAVLNDLFLFGCNIQTNTISVISKFSEAQTVALDIAEVPHVYGFALLFGMGCIYLMDFRDPTHPCWIQMITLKESAEDHNFDVDDEGMFEAAACALLELRDASAGKYRVDDPMKTDSENGGSQPSRRFTPTWSWKPDSIPPKLALFDDVGDLFVLDVFPEFEVAKMSLSDSIARVSSCKVLLWAKHETVIAIVEMGDGMLLKLENGRAGCIGYIQNLSPILDLSISDFHNEKQDQALACCGMKPEGTVRTIRSGICLERLLKTAPTYEGITGIWALQHTEMDPYHSFLVISFVEETRILTVGLNFVDVTESVGLRADVCTLACGLVRDGVFAQVHKTGVRVSSPTESKKVPISASWCPQHLTINLGAIGHNLIVVATSNPCFIFLLGFVSQSPDEFAISEIRSIRLQSEISCISVPKKKFDHGLSELKTPLPPGFEFDRTFLVGTHKPSLEIISVRPDGDCRILAIGSITISSNFGCPAGGCVPESIRTVVVDRFYVLVGLRNGVLLRYEWPNVLPMNTEGISASFPVDLLLVSFRQMGITPIVLVPVRDSLESDIIALGDRPWLLHAARHSIAYVSIPFQSATHVSSVSSPASPQGILFASENSLHLVEVNNSKRFNIEKFSLDGTCCKILYDEESKTSFVLRRGQFDDSCVSDICQLDLCSGSILARFNCESKEIAKCMKIVKVGSEKVLVVGTIRSGERIILPTGEPDISSGRLIIIRLRMAGRMLDTVGYEDFQQLSQETERLQVLANMSMPGAVLSVCSYLDRFVLASAGSFLCVCGFVNDNPHRLRRLATTKSRFTITSLTSHLNMIAVGDCRDGILFYTYHEEQKKLELLYSDPFQRLIGDCSLINCTTALVSDRLGMISLLSSPTHFEDNSSPERNLRTRSSYHLGEIVMSSRQGSIPADDASKAYRNWNRSLPFLTESIVCGTMLGNMLTLIALTREENELLKAVENKISVHPITAPILGNDHALFRGRGLLPGVQTMLDGDMLAQFLELTSDQQAQVLGLDREGKNGGALLDWTVSGGGISVIKVIELLEQINYALS